jgi:transposase
MLPPKEKRMADKALVAQLVAMLRADKSLNERQLKKEAARRLKRGDVPLAAIREARRRLGIDRASAQRGAEKMLREGSRTGPEIIEAIRRRFGVKLFAPELSRLRRKAGIAPLRRRGRPVGSPPDGAARPGIAFLGRAAAKGAIEVTFSGRGSAKELAQFFRRLAD